MNTFKNEFIKIGSKRIKIKDIKSYEPIKKRHKLKSSKPLREYHRKIWLSDVKIKEIYNSLMHENILVHTAEVFQGGIILGDVNVKTIHVESIDGIDDIDNWEKYIDVKALRTEYGKIKSIALQKSKEGTQSYVSGFFSKRSIKVPSSQIKEELSEHEAIIKIYENKNFSSKDHVIFTEGRLYFDGKMLRCKGSPLSGKCSPSKDSKEDWGFFIESTWNMERRCISEKELLESKELIRIDHEIPRPQVITTRYLEIKTYQNDVYEISENECDIDACLKELSLLEVSTVSCLRCNKFFLMSKSRDYLNIDFRLPTYWRITIDPNKQLCNECISDLEMKKYEELKCKSNAIEWHPITHQGNWKSRFDEKTAENNISSECFEKNIAVEELRIRAYQQGFHEVINIEFYENKNRDGNRIRTTWKAKGDFVIRKAD